MSVMPITFDAVAWFTTRHERARLMRPGEVIPSTLDAGFDLLGALDPNWVWVLDDGGVIKGVLVASPCHGAAMIWRISVSPDASSLALVRLLRAFLRDARRRGIRGYLTALSPEHESERRLKRIIEHAGGFRVGTATLIMMALPMPKENL